MGCLASIRHHLLPLGLVFLACVMALSVSADPDPPFVDGGTTTFVGEWIVDAGDLLTYVNQTIVLDGNLTIEASGTLELVNSTLVFNSSLPGEFNANVLFNGTLSVTQGSALTNGSAGQPWFAVVEKEAHLLIRDSTVMGAGFQSGLEILRAGIYSEANDTTVERTWFLDCYSGIAIANVTDPTIRNDFFQNMSYTGIWVDSGCTGVDLVHHNFTSCERGILIRNSSATVTWGRFVGGSVGIQGVRAYALIRDGDYHDQSMAAIDMGIGCRVTWRFYHLTTVVNTTVFLNGSIYDDAFDRGHLIIDNSSLFILNGISHGGHGIRLQSANMTVRNGSLISNGTAGYHYFWYVEFVANLQLLDSDIEGIGYAGLSKKLYGLWLDSNYNLIRNSTIKRCYTGFLIEDHNYNTIENVTIEDCIHGANITGTLSSIYNLKLTNLSMSGLSFHQLGRVVVDGLTINGSSLAEAIRVYSMSNSLLSNITVIGQPDIAISFEACWGNMDLVGLNATAKDTVVLIRDTSTRMDSFNITQASLSGGNVSVSIGAATNVVLTNVVSQLASSTGFSVQNSRSITFRGCSVDGAPKGFYIVQATDVRMDLCLVNGSSDQVSMYSTEDVLVTDCLFTHGTTAIYLEQCVNITIEDTNVMNAEVAVDVTGSRDVTVHRCSLSDVNLIGVWFQNGTRDSVLINLTVAFTPTAVLMTGNQTQNNRVDNISVSNCSLVLNLTDAGPGNALVRTVLVGVSRVVVLTLGSELEVRDCSIYDCPMFIDADETSYVEFISDSNQEIFNSTLRMRGRFLVHNGGKLTLSHVNVTFLDPNDAASGIRSYPGSTLLIVNGSSLWGGGQLAPYTIISEGTLVVRRSMIVGGGDPSGTYALSVLGDGAMLVNASFIDCPHALFLEGSNPFVINCTFIDDYESVFLNGTSRPEFTGCTFTSTDALWAVKGTFSGSLIMRNCSFDGKGEVATGIKLDLESQRASLTMTNVSLSNYESWGLEDKHSGSLRMVDCRLDNASIYIGPWSYNSVILTRMVVVGSVVSVGPGGFSVSDCTFINGSFKAEYNKGGSRINDCTFQGDPGEDLACVDIYDSSLITIADLTFDDPGVGLRIHGASEVSVSGCAFHDVTGTALEVDGSIARFESCQVTGLNGTGVRAWRTGSLAELRNCTIQALPASVGYDVDASGGGDVWLLNTTFDRTSVTSTGGGRVEVLWFVTVEPSLPWGGVLTNPENLVVKDATGIDVLNTSIADEVMRLHEFVDEDGDRTWHTPHRFTVSDTGEGVRYQGEHTIDASVHLVLELADVAAPVARAGPDKVVDENLVVTLDATGTSDNDPTFHTTGFFQWSFDDHGTTIVLTGDLVRHVFSVPGKYWINLTVTDWAGNVGTDAVIIQVRDVTPPDIRFTGNVTVDEDTWVILDASATTDNEPTFDAQKGRFLWEIDLPDQTLTSTTASFGHSFPEPGNFSGLLTVWDAADNQAQEIFWVLVMDATPPVIEGVSGAVVFEPADGLLDATACFDNVGITDHTWRVIFENGTAGTVELEGVSPYYLFDRLGKYTIELHLIDAAGNRNSTQISVVFDDVPVIRVPDFAMAMVGETLTIVVEIHDEYSTGITMRVIDGPSGASMQGSAANARLVWTPNGTVSGSDVVIEVEVHDGFVSSHDTIIVHVNPAHGADNQAPVILSEPPLGAKLDTPYVYSVQAEDPDGDMLGYILVDGPPGMTISQGGTVAWDPPFDHGVHLVEVHLVVTDGRDLAEQTWTIRWRDPPNRPPDISFLLDPLETGVNEEFLVNLATYVQDPDAYTLDEDDPNLALSWVATFDEGMVTLVSQDGLLFRFRALNVPGDTQVDFVVFDPSGGRDSVAMELKVTGPTSSGGDGATSWMFWVTLAVLLAVGLAGGAIAMRRRGEAPADIEADTGDASRFEPPPDASAEGDQAIAAALGDSGAEGIGTFVEVEKGERPVDGPSSAPPVAPVPGGTRVVGAATEGPRRRFQVEGVAVLGPGGSVTTSTGRVEEVVGPYQESLDDLRSKMGGQGSAVMEVEGRRVLIGVRATVGLLCVLRGREDDAFRDTLFRRLDDLSLDSSTEAALGVIEDVLAAAGKPDRAEVVQDAWTSHLEASITYRGSVLVLGIVLRNDTDHIMNNVRLRVVHDEDALTLDSIKPKVLVSHGKMTLGHVPSGKQQDLEISFWPELCMSSNIRVMMNYTDVEGRTIHVPTRSIPVAVECPYIEAGGDVDEDRLLSMSEDGLGSSGRRVYNYGLDVDHLDLFKIAVRLVVERGPMKVMDLEDESLMRAEAWFIGSGEGGSPKVLMRVSSHGADHLLELFVTSDDGATATGLLTYLSGEIMDTAASEMPGKRVERVRDPATLEEISVWPSLLDYKVMGE